MRGPAVNTILRDGRYTQVGERMSHTVERTSQDKVYETMFETYGAEQSKDSSVDAEDVRDRRDEEFVFFFINGDIFCCHGLILRKLSDEEYERVGTCVCKTDPFTFQEAQRSTMLDRFIASLSIKVVKIV